MVSNVTGGSQTVQDVFVMSASAVTLPHRWWCYSPLTAPASSRAAA